MKFPHSGNDCLASLLVLLNPKGGIFFGKLLKAKCELLLLWQCLGLYCHGDDRLVKLHGLEKNRGLAVAKGIPGGRLFESDGCYDISCFDLLEPLPLIGVHLQNSCHLFPLHLGSI